MAEQIYVSSVALIALPRHLVDRALDGLWVVLVPVIYILNLYRVFAECRPPNPLVPIANHTTEIIIQIQRGSLSPLPFCPVALFNLLQIFRERIHPP